MSMTRRSFGVEIECYNLPHPEVVRWQLNALGIQAYSDWHIPHGRYVRRNSYWNLHEDYSIRGQKERLELSSRILSGPEGLEEVRRVCRTLQKLGAETNTSCGLHVHVSTTGLSAKGMFAMLRRYALWESTIDTFVQPSRRESRNSCAKSVKRDAARMETFFSDALERRLVFRSKREFAETADSCHQKKLDFDSYFKYRTVEFRQHHGSVDPVEVTNWIKFCLNFAETSQKLAPTAPRLNVPVRDTGPVMGLDRRTRGHFLLQTEKYR